MEHVSLKKYDLIHGRQSSMLDIQLFLDAILGVYM